MRIPLVLIIFLFVNLSSNGQGSLNCYEIKYLDFFGLDQIEVVRWPQSELDGLLKVDFKKEREYSEVKTSFIIPMIAYQLEELHPNCNKNADLDYFDKLSQIYLRIRELDSIKFQKKSINEKFDFLRDDFYYQMNNIEFLPEMIMTFDDGPLYGVDYNEVSNIKPNKKQQTNFGTLSIFNIGKKTILSCSDNKETLIWQKLITGFNDRKLSDLHFTENPIEYNSVATVVHMYSEGERFTLYLKKDGSFMFYYHSW